jgi:hypothetical protein
MEKEFFSKSKIGNAFTAATVSTVTTTYGSWIDTFGFNSILFALKLAFTTGEISAIVIGEADESDYSDSASSDDANVLYAPDLLPVLSGTTLQVGTVSKKRYVRIGLTSASYGGSVNFTVNGMYVLSDGLAQPYDQYNTIEALADVNAPGALADATVTFPKL